MVPESSENQSCQKQRQHFYREGLYPLYPFRIRNQIPLNTTGQLQSRSRTPKGMRLFFVVTIYREAIISISSSEPRGSDFTATVERAGLCPGKRLPYTSFTTAKSAISTR